MRSAAPRIMMPGDGAVWPAIVSLPLRIIRSEVRRMVPDTSNTQTRGPVPSTQALSEPAPLALRFVTLYTVPPRPATRVHAEARRARDHRQRVHRGRAQREHGGGQQQSEDHGTARADADQAEH